MISIESIFAILILHFIGDFVLQSDRIAKNKSKSVIILTEHVSIYMVVMSLISPIYGVINAVLHFIVDFITSRITAHLWKNGKTHLFFVTIGFDQMLHMMQLIGTYIILHNFGFVVYL